MAIEPKDIESPLEKTVKYITLGKVIVGLLVSLILGSGSAAYFLWDLGRQSQVALSGLVHKEDFRQLILYMMADQRLVESMIESINQKNLSTKYSALKSERQAKRESYLSNNANSINVQQQ